MPFGLGKRYSADWAAIVVGLGAGLTLALYIESVVSNDWKTVYGVVNMVARVCALFGSYLAVVGLVLVSRISWVEQIGRAHV